MREHEYEAALRRAFVDRSADFIVVSSRYERFQLETLYYGVERGWLSSHLDESDEQSAALVARLTPSGKKHFGLGGPHA